MRKLLLIVLAAAALLGPAAVWAANTNSVLSMAGLGNVVLSVDADSAVVDELDASGKASKRAAVIACAVSGQAVVLLVRLQQSNRGLFLDIVADDTVTDLDTRVGSLNLSGRNHPSPTEDAVDTAILTAAAAD